MELAVGYEELGDRFEWRLVKAQCLFGEPFTAGCAWECFPHKLQALLVHLLEDFPRLAIALDGLADPLKLLPT